MQFVLFNERKLKLVKNFKNVLKTYHLEELTFSEGKQE